jgi:precorrin-8X/cobalt-precorrin-8 methylmutase
MLSYEYEKDPAAIYRQSFSIVRAEAELSHLPVGLHPVAIRLIHACGMTDLPKDLVWSDDVLVAAQAAFANGAPVFCDVEMVAHGIIRSRLPENCEVICTLNDSRMPNRAEQLGTTRSAAAVELWRDRLQGAVVAIGNAPTALFHLLEMIAAGGPKPALILGFPVGFVGAAESKDALADNPFGIPFLAVRGRRGGSAMAAAAVNALAAGLPEER